MRDSLYVSPAIDSLRQKLANVVADSQEIDILNSLALQWAVMYPTLAQELTELNVLYAETIKYTKGKLEALNGKGLALLQNNLTDSALASYSIITNYSGKQFPIPLARAHLGIGNANRISRKFKEATESTHKSLEIVDELLKAVDSANKSPEVLEVRMMQGSCYQNLGRINLASGNRKEAFEYLESALLIFNNLEAWEEVSSVLSNIATVYDRNKEQQKSIEAWEQSIEVAEKSGNQYLKATIFNNFGSFLDEKTNFSKALETFEKSLELRTQIGDKKGMAATLNNMGIVYKKLGDIALSLEYYEKSLQIKEQLNDTKGVAGSLNNIGVIYKSQGDIPRALDYYIRSAHAFEKINDAKGMASAYNNIGILYKHLDDIPRALDYYMKSLKARESVGDKRGLMAIYINTALIYKSQNENKTALEYLEKSLQISEEIGDKMGISSALSNLGTIYHDQGDMAKALDYTIRSLEIRKTINDKQGLAYSLHNMGSIYFDLKQFDKARSYTESSYKVSKELKFPKNIEGAATLLHKIYSVQGNYKKAYDFLNEAIEMQDSLSSKETKEEADKLHWKYQYDKKALADSLQHTKIIEVKNLELQKKQEVSKKQQIIILSLAVVFVLLIILAALIYRSFQIKLNSSRIISEKNEMLRQALEEIKATSDELYEKNKILEESQAEIQKQRNELVDLNNALQKTNKDVQFQNEELIRTQKQLVLSEKMASIGVLTAGIAHEINNPVNFVYAGVNSALRDILDISQVLKLIRDVEKESPNPAEFLNKILSAKKEFDFDDAYAALMQTLGDMKLGAQRIAEIVQGLRDFSRTDKDEFGVADINKVIEIVLTLMKNKYKNRVDIIRNFDEGMPEIMCKPGKVNQVFMNLVSNAIDAIGDTGTITITTGVVGNDCKISIKDTGKGMRQEILSKIFDPFYTTKEVGEGTGLGLSISYGIVQEHKGCIEVYTKEGEGSEFVVYLPINQT
jgi:signal transduction histidine kinase/Tfp pilus assembly protein PilF